MGAAARLAGKLAPREPTWNETWVKTMLRAPTTRTPSTGMNPDTWAKPWMPRSRHVVTEASRSTPTRPNQAPATPP